MKTISETLNPDERVKLHLKLSERYIDEAKEGGVCGGNWQALEKYYIKTSMRTGLLKAGG